MISHDKVLSSSENSLSSGYKSYRGKHYYPNMVYKFQGPWSDGNTWLGVLDNEFWTRFENNRSKLE